MSPITVSQAEALYRTLGPVPTGKTWGQHIIDSFRYGFMPESSAREVAITAAYLTKGYLDERERTGEKNSLLGEGEVEDVAELVSFAAVQEQWFVDRNCADIGCPGVYHYEFTEPLGAWLFHTDYSPTHELFVAELDRRWAEWTE